LPEVIQQLDRGNSRPIPMSVSRYIPFLARSPFVTLIMNPMAGKNDVNNEVNNGVNEGKNDVKKTKMRLITSVIANSGSWPRFEATVRCEKARYSRAIRSDSADLKPPWNAI